MDKSRLSVKVITTIVVLATSGCGTVGREISDAQISNLKKGETTTAQATTVLGQPTSVTKHSDGRQVLTYSFAHVQVRPTTFIPVVGLFAGGSDVRSSAVVLTFDTSGVLQDLTSHQSTTSTGTGLAGASQAQPETSLPQESK